MTSGSFPQDLVEIWSYVARENAAAADRLIDTIVDRCHLLGAGPELGERRPELDPRIRSFVGRYVVYYRPVKKKGIEVARVLHSARDVRPLL